MMPGFRINRMPIMPRSEKGATLIEVMITAVLIAIIAVSILPSFSELKRRSMLASFKVACNAMVKAKINEYVSGSGVISSATAGRVTNGWQYTKYRYQDTVGVPNVCRDPLATPATPGFRESVINNSILSDTAPTPATVPADLLGFQLWVNLRWYNPRVAAGAQPTRSCAATRTGVSQYQFLSVGDAIEVTVTGMIRTAPTRANGGRGNVDYAGYRDIGANPNPILTCSASQVIYPNRPVFRYYLGNDGKIRNMQSSEMMIDATSAGVGSAEAVESHFRNLWSLVPAGGTLTSPAISNLQGFSVAPDNTSVYLLKPGSISQYTGCTLQQVVVGAVTFNGAPNCPATPAKEWNINATVDAITVDFRSLGTANDDIIYGLRNSGPNATDQQLFKIADVTPASPQFIGTTDYTLPVIPRLISIFLVSNFPQTTPPTMYVADPSCYAGPAGANASSTFCVRVYNSTDLTLAYDMSDLPLQALAFSN